MANREDIALMSHLMRRAGFGATREEVEARAERGYEATVEELLDADAQPPTDEYTLFRHHPITEMPGGAVGPGQAYWLYHLLNTQRPLEEKMAVFWHQVFATGNGKVDNCNHLIEQIRMFREHGMGNYRDLLLKLASNPAMIFWLDNNENHKYAPNENWGRELLELFSLGVGNYTETDVFECSRAFTGWTIAAKMPRYPYGRHPWSFEFRPEDHDFSEKTFLGQTGNFDGGDIIDIILQQEACPRFISRHLYNFFVADEPQVPAWDIEEPRDPEAVRTLSKVLVDSGYEIDAGAQDAVQLRILQGVDVPEGQEPGRGSSGHTEDDAGRPGRGPEAGGAFEGAGLHGPGDTGPAERRGLAHGQGVDQQRLFGQARELRRGPAEQRRASRRAEHDQSDRRFQRAVDERW